MKGGSIPKAGRRRFWVISWSPKGKVIRRWSEDKKDFVSHALDAPAVSQER